MAYMREALEIQREEGRREMAIDFDVQKAGAFPAFFVCMVSSLLSLKSVL